MLLTRTNRLQLWGFALISLAALLIVAIAYAKVPQQLGVGRDRVTLELADASGLYPKAQVTYRGTAVGRVSAVDLQDDGTVRATLDLDSNAGIPSNSLAQIRSASVIGEQFVNLVMAEGDVAGPNLDDGDVISAEQVVQPTTTDELLTAVDDLASSVPLEDLKRVMTELEAAFDGTGPQLAKLIDDSGLILDAATDALPETIKLLDDAKPVLQTQKELSPELSSIAGSLEDLTGQLSDADEQLRSVLTDTAPFAEAVSEFADGVTPSLGSVLTDVAQVGQVVDTYLPSISHLLQVFPATEQAFLATMPYERDDDARPEFNVYFKLGFDPPQCTTGFRDKDLKPHPDDLNTIEPSPDDYCREPADSPLVVRGARNHPCPNGIRAAFAADCGYVFDAEAVARQNEIRSGGKSGEAVTPRAASFVAPRGELFLVDDDFTGPSKSWQELLTGRSQ